MYGKLMSINDELMWKYWIFLTDKKQSEIDAMRESVSAGGMHPMLVKKMLAFSITSDFHSTADAEAAAHNWSTQFQQKGVAEDLPEVEVSILAEGLLSSDADSGTEPAIRIPKLLQLAGLAASAGEASRKLAENAVSINGIKFTGKLAPREELGDTPVLRLGKKQVRVKWTA
jgi:tyrosyl-tRNA synthetase